MAAHDWFFISSGQQSCPAVKYTCEYYFGGLFVRLFAYHSIQRLIPLNLASGRVAQSMPSM